MRNGQRRRRYARVGRETPRRAKRCRHCNAEFIGAGDQNFCTLDHQYAWRSKQARLLRCCPTAGCTGTRPTKNHRTCDDCKDLRLARRALMRTLSVIATRSERDSRDCVHCGSTFTPSRRTARMCSTQCSKAHHRHAAKARRRQRMRGGSPVYRAAIIARDNGICQLCQRAVRMDVDRQHPLAPSMDHIVPLAVGGVHHPDNVQLAHLRCNSLKSDGRGKIDRRVAA